MFRVPATIVTVFVLNAAAVLAGAEWKTVTVDEDPSFTISVPAAAKVDGRGESGDLMFFSVTAGLHGSAWCAMTRAGYTEDATQAQFAAGLATPRRETFCNKDGATITDAHLLHSKSFEHNGVQAAACAVSYTDTAAKAQGQVQSHMMVVASRALYVFSCTVEDESQFDAEGDWTIFWADKIQYMQTSLRLPG